MSFMSLIVVFAHGATCEPKNHDLVSTSHEFLWYVASERERKQQQKLLQRPKQKRPDPNFVPLQTLP